jgi:hypothetical protein
MSRAKRAPVDAAPLAEIAEMSDRFEGVPRWKYVGTERRIYTNVPVTVDQGDVMPHAEIPAEDGCWESATGDYNRLPDNYTIPGV